MSYVLFIVLNILALWVIYYKFVAAIRKNAENSIKNYKVEAARTVGAFNKEFDRNLTILETRSNKLEGLLLKSEEYISTLLEIEKHLDINKTTGLIAEVKEQLETLEEGQRKLKEKLSKDRVHLDVKMEKDRIASLAGVEKEAADEKLFQDEIEKGLPKSLASVENSTIDKGSIFKDKKKESISEDIIDKELLLKAFDIGIKKSETGNNRESVVVEKAYKKSFLEYEDDKTIGKLLEQALEADGKSSEEEDFKNKLEKRIAKELLYSAPSSDDSNEEQAKPLSSVQSEVFSLLDEGKSILEICDILSISKGAAELHLHIYKMRKVAE